MRKVSNMPEFTKGKWWIAPPIFDGDAIFAPPSVEGRQGEVVAMGIMNNADARLIAKAPEMYKLIDRLVGSDAPVNTAAELFVIYAEMKMLLARIDGKETAND